VKYFLDTEFIEDGRTIDLISIALVSEDGRSFYRQNSECEFQKASEWVWRNVFYHLTHFDIRGKRSCNPTILSRDSGLSKTVISRCDANRMSEDPCPWRTRHEIRDEVLEFCNQEKYGKPEFWGYYSAYDWVAFCQLFGPMVALPKGYPMFCRDLIQWCKQLGNPELPKQGKDEHSALLDAHWNKKVWEFLNTVPAPLYAK
jgi:hypothetical protein